MIDKETKVVKCITLTKEQCKTLAELAELNGCSEAYILRRAFDNFVEGLQPLEDGNE